MKIFKAFKEFLFPQKYNGLEIAEMGKHIKFDYYTETVDLIYSSNKLTDSEKDNLVNNLIHGYTVDKHTYEYLKNVKKMLTIFNYYNIIIL